MHRNRTAIAALLLASAFALAGCSATAPSTTAASSSAPSKSATPTPTPTPTPTALTAAQAGPIYQKALCNSNLTVTAFNTAMNGSDLATFQKAAQASLTADQGTYKTLTTTLWPANVAADVKTVADEYSAEMAFEANILHATSMAQAYAEVQEPSDNGASQRVRAALGLPADGLAGCTP